MSNYSVDIPLRGAITFPDTREGKLLRGIIETREFQRLRGIKQLGHAGQTFPAATHTRYEHSLGVYGLACQFENHIETNYPAHYDDQKAFELKVKALVHDIGHGPLSHSFEVAMESAGAKDTHEDWTSKILLEDTEVGQLLEDFDPTLRQCLGQFFAKGQLEDFWDGMISSQFDIDRLDYLTRDAHHIGFPKGIDVDYLLRKTKPVEHDGNVCLAFDVDAVTPLQGYIFGRTALYNKLYHSPQGIVADRLLAEVFSDLKAALKRGAVEPLGVHIDNPIVAMLRSVSNIPLNQYLRADDSQLSVLLEQVERSGHADLARASRHAALLRNTSSIEVINFEEYSPGFMKSQFIAAEAAFKEIAREYGGDSTSFTDHVDKPGFKVKPNSPFKNIFIDTARGLVSIDEISDVLSRVRHGHFYTDSPEVAEQFITHLTAG